MTDKGLTSYSKALQVKGSIGFFKSLRKAQEKTMQRTRIDIANYRIKMLNFTIKEQIKAR